MLTLMIGVVTASEWKEIFGLILMGLEVLIVLITFLQFVIDPKSKFGKFLKKLLKGITYVKGKVEEQSKKDETDKTEK